MLVEPRGQITSNMTQLHGATVAVRAGTRADKLLSHLPDVKLLRCSSYREMFELVRAKKARALAIDSWSAFRYLGEFEDLQLSAPLTAELHLGFAVQKGSALQAELSGHIAQLKTSSIFFRLLEKYFGDEAVRAWKSGKAGSDATTVAPLLPPSALDSLDAEPMPDPKH